MRVFASPTSLIGTVLNKETNEITSKILKENIEMKENIIVKNIDADKLFADLRQIVVEARSRVASTANYALTMMYWHIGERINREVLGNERAVYGKQIVSAVSTQLTWSHIIEILPLHDNIQREFYLTMAYSNRWKVRQLR